MAVVAEDRYTLVDRVRSSDGVLVMVTYLDLSTGARLLIIVEDDKGTELDRFTVELLTPMQLRIVRPIVGAVINRFKR